MFDVLWGMRQRILMRVLVAGTFLSGMLGMVFGTGVAHAGALTNVSLSLSNTQYSATGVRYTLEFTPATSGTVTTLTFTVLTGTAGTITSGSFYGISGTGTEAVAGTTFTYTVTGGGVVTSGVPVYMEFNGFTNPSSGGPLTSTVTVNGTGDSGAAPALTYGATSTNLTVEVAETTALVGPALPSINLVLDPANNKTASATDSGFSIIANTGNGWTMAAYDSTNGMYNGTNSIAPVDATGVAGAVAFPAAADTNAFGYTMTVTGNDSTAGCGCGVYTIPSSWNSASHYAGFKHGVGGADTFISSTEPTGDTATTFNITYKVGVSFAAPAGNFTDTVTYVFTPAY